MGTKNIPGMFDCHDAAQPDEPLFTLLARDPLASHLVDLWADIRCGAPIEAAQSFARLMEAGQKYLKQPTSSEKVQEAYDTAEAMETWAAANPHA